MFGVNALQVKPVANGGRFEPTFFTLHRRSQQ
jgi:hypothetical protein